VGRSALPEALASGGLTGNATEVSEEVTKLEHELTEAYKSGSWQAKGELFDPSEGLSQGIGPLRELLQNGTWGQWAQNKSNLEKMRLFLGRANNLTDGNACPDDEEAHAGLCYKKCSLLTGDHPIRTSAYSCCREHPCTLLNQRISLKMCSGFDVAGESEGRGCPHRRGACYVDEEMHADRCYKRCSLLTGGEYMFRSAAQTCCKYSPLKSIMPCLDPNNTNTSKAFAAGGGELEPGHNASEGAATSHLPKIEAAEAPTASPIAAASPTSSPTEAI